MSRFLAAGIGCRKGCAGAEIAALVRRALEEAGLADAALAGLFAPAFKHGEAGVAEAAALLGLPLVLVPDAALKAAEARVATVSPRVIALKGLASVAESAALAGAGSGSRLVRPRIASASATCAIAVSEAAP